MDFQRFTILSETYGGRIARWPEAERKAAYSLADADARASALLREADGLDAVLDDWRVEPADRVLRQAVLASASGKARRGRRQTFPARDLRLWFAGAGLAAGLAGVFCGAVLSTVAVGEARDEALVASAVSDTTVALPGPAQT